MTTADDQVEYPPLFVDGTLLERPTRDSMLGPSVLRTERAVARGRWENAMDYPAASFRDRSPETSGELVWLIPKSSLALHDRFAVAGGAAGVVAQGGGDTGVAGQPQLRGRAPAGTRRSRGPLPPQRMTAGPVGLLRPRAFERRFSLTRRIWPPRRIRYPRGYQIRRIGRILHGNRSDPAAIAP